MICAVIEVTINQSPYRRYRMTPEEVERNIARVMDFLRMLSKNGDGNQLLIHSGQHDCYLMEGGRQPEQEELYCIKELTAKGLIWKVGMYIVLTLEGEKLLMFYDNPSMRRTEEFKQFLKEWGSVLVPIGLALAGLAI